MVTSRFSIVVASNDAESLSRNLMASPMVAGGDVPVHVERGASSTAKAYNAGLDATDAPIVIFAHQDVYFPPGWETQLERAIAEVEASDPDWALLAPFGMTKGGEHIGRVWTTSLSAEIGRPVTAPEAAETFDELVIVLRRASGIRFDDALPGWHLYGTDIVQTAKAAGKGAYVVHLPLVHNDKFYAQLGRDFATPYHYVRRKWRKALPLRTPVLWIRWHGLDLPWYELKSWRSVGKRNPHAGDAKADPRVYSAQCGWESGSNAGI